MCFYFVYIVLAHFGFTDSVLREANAALTEENRRLRFEVQDSLVRYQLKTKSHHQETPQAHMTSVLSLPTEGKVVNNFTMRFSKQNGLDMVPCKWWV